NSASILLLEAARMNHIISPPLAGVLLAFCGVVQAGEPQQAAVFTSGEGGYHTYRIPSLIVSQQGTLLAFCEGRKNGRGDPRDIDLLCKRSSDGGKTWGKTQVVWD